MEGLNELVAAVFARHRIECPVEDSQFVWERAPSPVGVGTAALGCPAEHRSAVGRGHNHASTPAVRPAEPTLTTALPDHNYKKLSQEICP
jgi:hypothetical protein